MTVPIRVVTEPGIYVVGRQKTDHAALAAFLEATGAGGWESDAGRYAEEIVEVCSRLCYHSYAKPRPGGNQAHLEHILEVGHGSVLEHAAWTILFTGVSRSLTHELVRHRVGLSPSQLSQRFHDEADCAFVVPPALMDEVAAAFAHLGRFGEPIPSAADALDYGERHAQTFLAPYAQPTPFARAGLRWLAAMEQARRAYADLAGSLPDKFGDATGTARRKRAREAARSVLPNCVETRVALTGNARAWRHLLELRGAPEADAEFRRLALALLPVLQHEAPTLFGDMEVRTAEDGTRHVHSAHPKV